MPLPPRKSDDTTQQGLPASSSLALVARRLPWLKRIRLFGNAIISAKKEVSTTNVIPTILRPRSYTVLKQIGRIRDAYETKWGNRLVSHEGDGGADRSNAGLMHRVDNFRMDKG